MINILKSIYCRLRKKEVVSDFNKSNPLGGDGERVDITLDDQLEFSNLDIYQKNHIKRYEFANHIINKGEVCGDFACGTGYGSVLIAYKAIKVIAADIDTKVIKVIKKRYKQIRNVTFFNENLLNLEYENYFDTIISFETIEHFKESDIKILIRKFNTALKENGKLIFSTPYMQEKSENAEKMGFHLTFYIDVEKIKSWLEEVDMTLEIIKFQNYDTHFIQEQLEKKDFIICVAKKSTNG